VSFAGKTRHGEPTHSPAHNYVSLSSKQLTNSSKYLILCLSTVKYHEVPRKKVNMEPLLTTEEVADYLRVDIVTVRRLVNRGELTAYRIGSEYRFTQADIDDFVKQQRVHIGENGRKEPFKHFTVGAREAMALAVNEARRLEHNYVGTEHMLLGLASEGEGVAAHVLNSLGFELDKARNEIVSIIKHAQEQSNPVLSKIKAAMFQGESVLAGRQVGLTPRAKKVIELAADEAKSMGHHYIATEHLLLGIIREGEGLAVDVLKHLGIDPQQVRTKALEVMKAPVSATELPVVEDDPSALQKNLVTCSNCGKALPASYSFCYKCGNRLAQE
jgi:excisionase family DNA binding protein